MGPSAKAKGNDLNAPGEEANLDYARRATELALSQLKDELAKPNPDAELLKKLGWTKEDLQRFVARWEKMKAEANAPDQKRPEAKRELDEALRSIGLQPKTTTLQGANDRDDQSHGLRQTGRTAPPAEYEEQYEEFLKGAARPSK